MAQPIIFGIGNPLLDISTTVSMDFLNKYNLKSGNAIMAEAQHLPLYKELVENYNVEYIAGGATQNSIRVAQWLLPPHSTAYTGGVGNDEFGKTLRKVAENDGVQVEYMIHATEPTGTCAVLLHEKERSLVANLAAANHFQQTHLHTEVIQNILKHVKIVYSAGFFLTACPEGLMYLADYCAREHKIFCGNVSAPFIPQFFTDRLLAAIPYYDFLFGNESEAEALGEKLGLTGKSLEEVAAHVAAMDKVNTTRERTVVFTQGSKATIVATVSGGVKTYPVDPLADDLIVDVNGAGDAFVGGFLAKLSTGANIDECVRVGHLASRHILQVSGTILKDKPTFEF
jgi:adenosine kinase